MSQLIDISENPKEPCLVPLSDLLAHRVQIDTGPQRGRRRNVSDQPPARGAGGLCDNIQDEPDCEAPDGCWYGCDEYEDSTYNGL